MRKKQRYRCVLLSALGLWLVNCGLEAELPSRNGSVAPVNSGVTLSGAGMRDDADAGVYGERTRITNIESNAKDSGPPAASGSFADSGSGGTGARASGGAGARASGGTGARASGGTGARASGGTGAGEDAGAAGVLASKAGSGSALEAAPPVLYFSEYVEGSSSDKALEITARTRSQLEGCKIGTYFNGKTEATIVATLSGVLEAGAVLTVCSDALKQKLPDVCAQVGNLSFNGDDALALSCAGAVLDVIGQIGVDPGAAWGSEPNSTLDHTLRRKCSVQSGDPLGENEFDPSLEWQIFPRDSFDGLGTLGC